MNQDNHFFGAKIERGLVRQATDDGYVVESYDRKGLVTTPIKAINQNQYDAGSRVYFFVFDDGRGKILALMDE